MTREQSESALIEKALLKSIHRTFSVKIHPENSHDLLFTGLTHGPAFHQDKDGGAVIEGKEGGIGNPSTCLTRYR